MRERLILIDTHSLVYRGFFAIPPLTTTKGELSNATFGFVDLPESHRRTEAAAHRRGVRPAAEDLSPRARRDLQGHAQAHARRAPSPVRAREGAPREVQRTDVFT